MSDSFVRNVASTTDGGEAYADWEAGPPPWGAPRGTAPWPPRAGGA